MPWGTSEGGTPQPYRIEIESAHWEKARNRDGELVVTRNGENLMNLIFEGNAYRLVEESDGSYSVGDPIEPLEGKYNRRSFLLGNTSQWQDPREDGKTVENTRGPDQMPWSKSEVGRLINSLVELLGTDELETWGKWEEADTWAGRTLNLVPTHDVNDDGEPVTFTTSSGDTRIDWYFIADSVGEEEKKKRGKGRSRAKSNGTVTAEELAADYKKFDGSEDDFVDYIQSDEYRFSEELAKLTDDAFDKLIEEALA